VFPAWQEWRTGFRRGSAGVPQCAAARPRLRDQFARVDHVGLNFRITPTSVATSPRIISSSADGGAGNLTHSVFRSRDTRHPLLVKPGLVGRRPRVKSGAGVWLISHQSVLQPTISELNIQARSAFPSIWLAFIKKNWRCQSSTKQRPSNAACHARPRLMFRNQSPHTCDAEKPAPNLP